MRVPVGAPRERVECPRSVHDPGGSARRLPTRFARRLSAGVLAGLLASAVGITGLSAAQAQEDWDEKQTEIDEKVDGAGDLVQSANDSVAAAAADLAEAEAELPAAQAALDEAKAREQRAEDATVAAEADLANAVSELDAAEERLATIEAALEDLRSSMGDFARRAYQMGPYADLEMLLDARDPSDFTDRLAAMRAISRSNNDAIGDLAANRADQAYLELRLDALRTLAEEKKAIAEVRLAEAEAAALQATRAKKLVDALIEQRDAALAIAEAQRSRVEGQYEKLLAEQKRIQEAAQRAAELARRLARQNSQALEGSLGDLVGDIGSISGDGFLWPVSGGNLTQGSGPRVHPVYGYASCHTGVDISGGYGTPLRAVQAGVVAAINNGGPYGLHTIIAHGDGVTSFYAHQSRTAVSVGSIVDRGEIVGYVGTTGWVTGPHLHFEIHRDGRPHDPMGWYGGAKNPVSCA